MLANDTGSPDWVTGDGLFILTIWEKNEIGAPECKVRAVKESRDFYRKEIKLWPMKQVN